MKSWMKTTWKAVYFEILENQITAKDAYQRAIDADQPRIAARIKAEFPEQMETVA